jgi:hypothetical protein
MTANKSFEEVEKDQLFGNDISKLEWNMQRN